MRNYIATLVAVALLLAPCATAVAATDRLEVKPGTLSVKVLDYRSEVMPEASLKLANEEGEALGAVKADKEGKCALNDLEAGAYKLLVADRVILPFIVSDKAKVTNLIVVVPARPRYAAGQFGGGLGAFLSNPWVIAALVATAIAIPVAIHNSRDGSNGGPSHP
ncbi:MAG: hypothetical protein ABIF82_14535 [Planctomycetota bacterium]